MKAKRDPDFDASADMRLVELQRATLGVPSHERSAWESSAHLEGGVIAEQPAEDLSTAVIAVEATANPPSAVIPGAIVTIGLSITNEGAVTARNVRVTVPLPGGAAFRNGSFVRDGRPLLDDSAEELFTVGTLVSHILSKTRVTFLWKIGVRLGNKPLVIAPAVSAEDGAVIGSEPLLISRKEGAQSTFATEIVRIDPALYAKDDLPIYELDEEELIEYEATESALSSVSPKNEVRPGTQPPVQPGTPPPDQPEPVPPPDQPAPVPEPGVPAVEPEMPVPPEQPPDIEPAAAEPVAPTPEPLREAVALVGQIDRPSIAYFERIFSGSKPPTLLNHFILGGALACTRSLQGDDLAGLKAHLDAQGQLLQRIVLHEKLGKKELIGEYAGSMLARVDQFTPKPVTPLRAPQDRNAALLYVELDGPTLGILQRMQEESARWDFTKARQLTLALQARSVSASAPVEKVEAADAALRSYAQTATMQLQRFFVRMRLDRTTGLLFAQDEALDNAARVLISALTALF